MAIVFKLIGSVNKVHQCTLCKEEIPVNYPAAYQGGFVYHIGCLYEKLEQKAEELNEAMQTLAPLCETEDRMLAQRSESIVLH